MRPTHYSPQISRFLVSVLYHEAKRRRIPMTRLVDQLLTEQLSQSETWQRIAEESPPYITNNTGADDQPNKLVFLCPNQENIWQ